MKKPLRWLLAFLSLTTLLVLILGPQTLRRTYYGVRYVESIRSQAASHQISPHLVAAVIYTESRFRPQVTSEVGARGLMQLMPDTAKEMAQKQGLEDFRTSDLETPAVNIKLGTTYLAHLMQRFHTPEDALAAYNAGPTAVLEWKQNRQGVAYPETRHYIKQVKKYQKIFEELYPEWSENGATKGDRDS